MSERVLPVTRAQVARWNILNKGDLFAPIFSWPDELRRLALLDHLSNLQRFFFFGFLVHNGADPDWASHVLLSAGTYDQAAVNHVNFLTANYTRYPLKYWDLAQHAYVNYAPGLLSSPSRGGAPGLGRHVRRDDAAHDRVFGPARTHAYEAQLERSLLRDHAMAAPRRAHLHGQLLASFGLADEHMGASRHDDWHYTPRGYKHEGLRAACEACNQ
nr:MAG: hypothetical protein [Cressdnaviricota sp.]